MVMTLKHKRLKETDMQNEYQNAYYVSQQLQAERNVLDIPEGMFAVVCCSLAYCQFTDATLPNPNRSLVKLFASRKIADHVAKVAMAKLGDGEDYEVWYDVYPKLPPVVRPAPTYTNDDIPF